MIVCSIILKHIFYSAHSNIVKKVKYHIYKFLTALIGIKAVLGTVTVSV